MKVSELKKCVNDLKSCIESEEDSEYIVGLISRFIETLSKLNEEDDFQSEMVASAVEIIHEYWNWAIQHLSYDAWQNDPKVTPCLSLQNALVKAHFLSSDFHHPLLYQTLKNHYDTVAENQLSIVDLIPLFVSAGRMIGYAEERMLADYPMVQLREKIKTKRPQEIEKLKDVLVLLRSILYLLYKYCTPEQLGLLSSLIYFRSQSTDEERCSELAILNSITKQTLDWIQFFQANQNYMDMRSIKEIDVLRKVSDLMPSTGKAFLRATDEKRWIYPFIQKSRLGSIDNLLDETLYLLDMDFAMQKDKSYTAVLDFITGVKKQMRTLTNSETKIAHSAAYLFCLQQYKMLRQGEAGYRHSLLSFSVKTKCDAAEKKQLAIRGKPITLDFFETIALKQGRLKTLIEFLEDKTTSLNA